MADLDHETIDFESAQALGDNYCVLVGKVNALNCEDSKIDVKINGDVHQNVPVFYHCQGESTALPAGSCAPKSFDMFYRDQEGILVLHDLTGDAESEYTIIGFQYDPSEDKVKECVNKYLVVYIHKRGSVYLRHGIVWDLAMDKMAEGIKDRHGNEVTFPCDGDVLYYIERHSLGQRVSRLNTEGSDEVCDNLTDHQTTSRILFSHADDRIFCGDCDEVGAGIDPWRCPEDNLALRSSSLGIIFECSGSDSDKPYFEADADFGEEMTCEFCQVYRPTGEPYYIKYCVVEKDLYGVSNKTFFEIYPHHTCKREIDTWWHGEGNAKVKKEILTTYVSCERYDSAFATPDYADIIYWNRRLSMVFSAKSPMGMMIIDGARSEDVPTSYVPMEESIKSAVAGDSARYGDLSPPGEWGNIPGLFYQSDSSYKKPEGWAYSGEYYTDNYVGHGIDQFAGFTYIRQEGTFNPKFCCFQVCLYYFVYRPYNFDCYYTSQCKEYTDTHKAKVHVQFKFERPNIYEGLTYDEETHHEDLEHAIEDLVAQHFGDWGWEKAVMNMKMYHHKSFVEDSGG